MSEPHGWATLLPPLLQQAGLDATIMAIRPLTGGVSSDIVAVHLSDAMIVCAKRALAKLKVASDWHAPIERNASETAYLRKADAIVPGCVPEVLAEDPANGVALLQYLPSERFSLWKDDLLAERIAPAIAERVGGVLGAIHAATLRDAATAKAFANDALFDALRIEPYLTTLAQRRPELSSGIDAVIASTRSHRLALVHGDVSPKNIFVERESGAIVLLDAECAWYGDPAFDAAFCINHLLLKSVHLPHHAPMLIAMADALFRCWTAHFPVADRGPIELRTAHLLPCLLLARIEGKSPVEYLSEAGRDRVRQLSVPLIATPPAGMAELFLRFTG